MNKKLIGMAAVAALVAASLSTGAMARRGADDPAGHVRGEGAGHTSLVKKNIELQMARRGADDPAGHQRQCRGCDDAPNHG
jgi:hypothetical protein